VLWLVVLSSSPPVHAASALDMFVDPTDGAFDTSDWLLNRRGFLPVPIIITEPAVCCGGGGSLPFFHKSMWDEEKAT
jgi:hypothetical protein